MHRFGIVLGAALAWIGIAHAASDAVEFPGHDCDGERVSEAQQVFDDEFRSAQPGSDLYVPVPWPSTDEEVIRDAQWHYSEFLKPGKPASTVMLGPGEATVRDALEKNALRFEVHKLVSWKANRCSTEAREAYEFLVRAIPASGKSDLSRMLLGARGLYLSSASSRTGDNEDGSKAWPPPMLKLNDAISDLQRRVPQVTIEEAEYIDVDTMASCPSVIPCLAFRTASGTYVTTHGGDIYRLGGRNSVRSMDRLRARSWGMTLGAGEIPFSVGRDRWVTGVKVDAAEVE